MRGIREVFMIAAMKAIRIAIVALLAAAVAGCLGEITDVTEGVDSYNRELAQQGAELDCPDEVDGGEGTTFECTLRSTKTDKTAKVDMKIVEENGDLAVTIGDTRQFDRALAEVTA